MAPLIIPSHVHSSSPDFVARIEGQRIFLDVGTLLRAVLFKESHSNRIIEHIERTKSGVAVVSFHVRDKAVEVLTKHYPVLKDTFVEGYLSLVSRRLIEVVSNGDVSKLSDDAASHDPTDDAVVLASSLSANCTYLATLDKEFAMVAAKYISVLPPCEPEYSTMRPVLTQLPQIYTRSDQGTLLMLVRPKEGLTNFTNYGGRRYVFATDVGIACWLSEKSWQYEIGLTDCPEPLYRFDVRAQDDEAFVGLSYDLREGKILAAFSDSEGNTKIHQLSPKLFPQSIGTTWSIMGQGEQGSFYWRGVLSSGQLVERSGLDYAVRNRSFFLPLDAQRFKLEDAVIEPSLVLVPEKLLGEPS